MTTAEYLHAWIEEKRDTVRPRTLESYEDVCRRYIGPALGGVDIDELTPAEVRSLLARVVAEGHSRTAEVIYTTLRAATGEDYPRLMRRVERPVHIQRMPRPWNDEQIAAYWAAIDGHRHELPLALGLGLGLRRGEICGLRWQDVDLTEGLIYIVNQRVTLRDGRTIDCPPKSRASVRVLPIPDTLAPLLAAGGEGYITKLTPNSLDRVHRDLVRAIGLPYIPLHGLRHSLATACLRHGAQMRNLQAVLGHSSLAVTASRYTHPDEPMLLKTINAGQRLGFLTLNQGV